MWVIDVTDEGQVELTAPNGEVLFVVNKDTALMLADMLRDTAESDVGLSGYDDDWENE